MIVLKSLKKILFLSGSLFIYAGMSDNVHGNDMTDNTNQNIPRERSNSDFEVTAIMVNSDIYAVMNNDIYEINDKEHPKMSYSESVGDIINPDIL